MQAGVIDPKKVTRTALQNAASVAGLLLTTEALVAEKRGGSRRAGGRAWETWTSNARKPPLTQTRSLAGPSLIQY